MPEVVVARCWATTESGIGDVEQRAILLVAAEVVETAGHMIAQSPVTDATQTMHAKEWVELCWLKGARTEAGIIGIGD